MRAPFFGRGELVAEDESGVLGFVAPVALRDRPPLHAPARVGERRRPHAAGGGRGGPARERLHRRDAVDRGAQRARPPGLRGGGLAAGRPGQGTGVERRAADGAAVPQSALNRAVGLVLLAAISPQVGAAFAVEVFDELGPAGAAFGRLAFAAVILVALWRPRIARPADRRRDRLRARARRHEPVHLRGDGPHPAGRRGDVRGHRPARARRRPLAASRSTWCGWRSRRSGSSGSPTTRAARSTRSGSRSRSPPARCGRRTSSSPSAPARSFPGGSGLAIAMVAGAVLVAPLGIADAGADLLQPELFGVADRGRDRLVGAALLARDRGAARGCRGACSAC